MTYIHGVEGITSLAEIESKLKDLESVKRQAELMPPAAKKDALRKISEDAKLLEQRKKYLEKNLAKAKSSHMAHHLGVPVPKPSHAKAPAAKALAPSKEQKVQKLVETAHESARIAEIEEAQDDYVAAIPLYFEAAVIFENFDPKKNPDYASLAKEYRSKINSMGSLLSPGERGETERAMRKIHSDFHKKGLRTKGEREATARATAATAAAAEAGEEEAAPASRPAPARRRRSGRGRSCGCFSRQTRSPQKPRPPRGGGKKKRKRNKTIRKKIIKTTKRVKRTRRVKRTKRR